MKTIVELQQEIRSIRKEFHWLDGRLEMMGRELLNYKEGTSDHSAYERIYQLARSMPMLQHPILKETVAVKNNYFAILLMVAVMDDSINEDQLLFLQRMVLADDLYPHLEHYLSALGAMVPENVLYEMSETIKEKYADRLLLDMLIFANLSRGDTREAFEMIANIAAFLHVDKENLKKTAKVASAILKQKLEELSGDSLETIGINETYGYYLHELAGWDERVKKALEKKAILDAKEILAAKMVGEKVWKHLFAHEAEAKADDDDDDDDWYLSMT